MQYIIKERATGAIVASGDENSVQELEGNWYFSRETVDMAHLRVTERTYNCPYKGICNWIDLESPGGRAQNIAWVYTNPKPGYEGIKGLFGFYDRDTAGTMVTRT